MSQKLTITVSDEVYKGLYAKIGAGRISRFIDSMLRPHVLESDLDAGYQTMASDVAREHEAWEWSEALANDFK